VTTIEALTGTSWTGVSPAVNRTAVESVEQGAVLFFPSLAFSIQPDETALFSPAVLSSAKNTSFDPQSRRVGGTTVAGVELERLRGLMVRFSDGADTFIRQLLPSYGDRLLRSRASFRPAEIAGRASSWRKDDTRLHVDSFPATPVQGRRILRLFTNVNPAGKPRSWRVGDDFERVAERFAGALAMPMPGASLVLRLLRVTKSRRSAYDALMLQLHDRMKADTEFQAQSPQTPLDFPAGSTWVCFTDQVSHAAMAGQYQLEQTFLLPLEAMNDQSRSPLRILERLKGRSLS